MPFIDLPLEGGGGGSSSNSFTVIQTPSGTSPTASSSTDTLTYASASGTVVITGNSGTKTVDLRAQKVIAPSGTATEVSSDAGITINSDGVSRAPTASGWLEIFTNGRMNFSVAGNVFLTLSNRFLVKAPLVFLDGGASENTVDIGLSPSAALERPRNIYVGTNINIPNLPVYANDAAAGAGGLAAGWLYKTATGEVRVKL